jgi:CRP-like cAMP-binding protein
VKKKHAPKRVPRTDKNGNHIANEILLALPPRIFNLVQPHLQYVELAQHRILYEPHKKLKFVHFPNRGLISLVVVLKNGKTVEAGVVGNEGASGTALSAGMNASSLREVVQISGDGFRIRDVAFEKLSASHPEIRTAFHKYLVLTGMHVSQTAACNRLHEIEQRLARWLLTAEDSANSATLNMTHDFLATMLGTDRPSVTLAAGLLQREGLIEYKRASVRIINRPGLEAFSCECYGVIRQYTKKFCDWCWSLQG